MQIVGMGRGGFSLPVLKATKVAPTPFKVGSIKKEWKILPKK
jgi:hypothetical protein